MKSKSPEGIKPNILMAIPYCDERSIATLNKHGDKIRFLIDSGAFTAWKSGKPMLMDTYCKFIESLSFKPFGYFTLDVIGDPAATRANYAELLKRGMNPIPIFTRGSAWEELESYFAETDYVGVGGLVGTNANKLYLRDVMQKLEGKDRKIHWLGFTGRDFLIRWKPYSCDSSSWHFAMSHRYLGVYLGFGKIKYVYHQDFRDDTANLIKFVKPWADLCGEDVFKLRQDDEWAYNKTAGRISWKTQCAYAIEMERRSGVKVFFAITTEPYIPMMLDCWWQMKELLKA